MSNGRPVSRGTDASNNPFATISYRSMPTADIEMESG